jgi:hypothetical protein
MTLRRHIGSVRLYPFNRRFCEPQNKCGNGVAEMWLHHCQESNLNHPACDNLSRLLHYLWEIADSEVLIQRTELASIHVAYGLKVVLRCCISCRRCYFRLKWTSDLKREEVVVGNSHIRLEGLRKTMKNGSQEKLYFGCNSLLTRYRYIPRCTSDALTISV